MKTKLPYNWLNSNNVVMFLMDGNGAIVKVNQVMPDRKPGDTDIYKVKIKYTLKQI